MADKRRYGMISTGNRKDSPTIRYFSYGRDYMEKSSFTILQILVFI
jgi:hypothetical protein